LRIDQSFDQLVFGVWPWVKHFSELLQKAALVFGFSSPQRPTGGNVGHMGCR